MDLSNKVNPNPTYQGTPFVRITLGKIGSTEGEIFTVGDGRLIKASVTLAEGKTLSNCSFSVYDPDKILVDKFFSYIESVDGLDTIEPPTDNNNNSTDLSTSNLQALGDTGNFTQDSSQPPEVRAFLDAIHFSENDGYGDLYKQGGYNVMFSGKTFSSYNDHPRVRFPIGSTYTTAAGRYQFLDTTWDYLKSKLKLTDFSPISQDKGAVQLIKDRGAYKDITSGNISRAANKLNRTWTSLPGGPEQRKTNSQFVTFYQQRLAAYRQLINNNPSRESTQNPLQRIAGVGLERANQNLDTIYSMGGKPPLDITNKLRTTINGAASNLGVNVNKDRINDWPLPKIPATKNIIVFPGHLADTSGGGGTSGTGDSNPVLYKGEQRVREFIANDILYDLVTGELAKAGYNIISLPTLPPGRGDTARNNYYDAIKSLKESTSAYAFELHFDAKYIRDSSGRIISQGRSGVIPGGKYDYSGSSLSIMDVALAKEFGSFTFEHRKSLGGPRRGITLLEIDTLDETKTSLINQAIASGNYQPLREHLRPYAQRIVKALNTVTNNTNLSNNTTSVNNTQSPKQEIIPEARTLAGAQITIELGFDEKIYSASSFIHTGLKYSLFAPDVLEFTGQAASWVLNQRVKNIVYSNLSFKKIAQKITSSYGMKLDMPEEGPIYDYFPQRGISDYEALLIEARRIGYRVYTKGATLFIKPRENITANKEVFTLIYGANMGTSFEVIHTAQTDSKGGARSSQPGSNNSTGERKFEIDPDTGQVKQKRKENVVGTGDSIDLSTTGTSVPIPTPITKGLTDKEDADRRANEDRIKGIIATTSFPTTPEALTLDPDTPFLTSGISEFLDRMWVVDSVTHNYNLGSFSTDIQCYSPLKNKVGSAEIISLTNINSNNPINNSTFDPNAPKFIRPTPGVITSKHRTENSSRPNHRGIDYGDPVGTPIQAAAAGTVTTASFGWNGGYGTLIIISHGNGWETRYSHLSQIAVTQGQQVTQGQIIGKTGNTGDSTG